MTFQKPFKIQIAKPFKIHHSKNFTVLESNAQGMFLALRKCLDILGSQIDVRSENAYDTPIDNDPNSTDLRPLMLVREGFEWDYFADVSLRLWVIGNRGNPIFCFLGFADPREQSKPIALTVKLRGTVILFDYYGDTYQARALLQAVSKLIGLEGLLVPGWWTLPGIVYGSDRYKDNGLLWDTDLKETVQLQPSQRKFQNIEQALCQFEVEKHGSEYRFSDIRHIWVLETFPPEDQVKIMEMMKKIHETSFQLKMEARELMENLPRPNDYLTGNQIGVIKQ